MFLPNNHCDANEERKIDESFFTFYGVGFFGKRIMKGTKMTKTILSQKNNISVAGLDWTNM